MNKKLPKNQILTYWIKLIGIATLSLWAISSNADSYHGGCRIAVPGQGTGSTYEYAAVVNISDLYNNEIAKPTSPDDVCIMDNNNNPPTYICTNSDFNNRFLVSASTCQFQSRDRGKWVAVKGNSDATSYRCQYLSGKPIVNVTAPKTSEPNYDQKCVNNLGSHKIEMFLKRDNAGNTVTTSEKHSCFLQKEDKTLICKYPTDNLGGITLTADLCLGTKWVNNPASKTYTCSK